MIHVYPISPGGPCSIIKLALPEAGEDINQELGEKITTPVLGILLIRDKFALPN